MTHPHAIIFGYSLTHQGVIFKYDNNYILVDDYACAHDGKPVVDGLYDVSTNISNQLKAQLPPGVHARNMYTHAVRYSTQAVKDLLRVGQVLEYEVKLVGGPLDGSRVTMTPETPHKIEGIENLPLEFEGVKYSTNLLSGVATFVSGRPSERLLHDMERI